MRGSLVQVSPLDPATGSRVVIRAGYSGNPSTLRADGQKWFAAVSKAPAVSLDFFDINYTGAVQLGRAQLTLNTRRFVGMNRDYLTSLIWDGAPITIWSGNDKVTAAMNVEFVGLVTGGVIDRSSGLLPLTCEVNKKLVDVPLLNAEFGGGGGYDGDPEVRGQLRPACFGHPVNVPVFFFDQVHWIGQVDGYGNCTAIDTLYEDAASFGAKDADYATYGALLAAVIPEGSWATCVAQGLVRLGANPQGVITSDPVCGFGTPGAMIQRWLSAHAGITAGNINSGSMTDLDAALTALLGHAPAVSYYTQSQVQVSERVQAMCAACNATWFIGPDGKIAVSRAISNAAPLVTLKRLGGKPLVTDWRSLDAPEPSWRLKSEAAKTWRVHTLQEIDYEDDLKDMGDFDAAETYRQGMIVRSTSDGARYLYINVAPSFGHAPPDVAYWELYEDAPDASMLTYVDGTPLEYLKPAQPNADVTAANAAVGDANRVRFSKMEKGTLGWLVTFNPNGVAGPITANIFNGKNYVYSVGNMTANNQVVSTGSAGASDPNFRIAVTPGERIFVGAQLGIAVPSGLATWALRFWFADAAGAALSNFDIADGAPGVGVATWTRFGGFTTVPAGAVFGWVECYVFANLGGGGAYGINLGEVMVSSAGSSQTVFPAFSPGPSNELGADVTAANAAVGDANRVRLSRFEQGTAGFAYTTDGSVTVATFATGVGAVAPFVGLEYLRATGTFDAANHTLVLYTDAVAAGQGAFRIPVTPGERIFVGARIEVQAANPAWGWNLHAGFRDDAGAAVAGGADIKTGTGNVAFNTRVGGFCTVPAGAVYMTLELYLVNLATTGAFVLSLREPQVSSAGTTQTIFPNFTPGPSNELGASVDANISGEATVIVYADVAGHPKAGELSKTATYKLFRLGAALVTGVTWAVTLLSGNVTYTTSVTAGVLSLVLTGPNDATLAVESDLRVTATYQGVPRSFPVKVLRQDDPPTNSGSSGGTTVSTTLLGNTTGTTYDTTNAVSATLTARTGPTGRVDLTAPLSFKRYTGYPDTGETGCYGKWQWRALAGTFADVAAETAYGLQASVDNEGMSNAGSISATAAKTALTASTDYEFRFLWRRVDVSGSADDIYLSGGTLQAAGS